MGNESLIIVMKELPARQLRDTVAQAIRDHYAHVRAVSSEEFVSRYFHPSCEQAAIEKVVTRIQMMARYLPPEGSTFHVLDVGVGTGSLAVALGALGFDVYGLDDDGGGQRQLSTLARRFPALEMQVCALETDDYPYEDNTFDVVASFDVIEHLPGSPRHYLMEINRVLKPGGVFFLSTPNVASLANRVLLLMGRSIYDPLNEWFNANGDDDTTEFSGHWREYTVTELTYMVETTEFRVVEKGYRSRRGRARVLSVSRKIAYAVLDLLSSTIFKNMADEAYVICRKPAR